MSDEWVWIIGGIILTVDNRNIQRKTCTHATLSTTNPTWNGLQLNLDFCDDRLATNCLSHGMALYSLSIGFCLCRMTRENVDKCTCPVGLQCANLGLQLFRTVCYSLKNICYECVHRQTEYLYFSLFVNCNSRYDSNISPSPWCWQVLFKMLAHIVWGSQYHKCWLL